MHGSTPFVQYGPGATQLSEPTGDIPRDPLPLPRDPIHIRENSQNIPTSIRDSALNRDTGASMDLPLLPREPKDQDSSGESMAQFLKKALRIEGAQLTQKTITIR